MRLLSLSSVKYDEDTPLLLPQITKYIWWKDLNNLETEEKIGFNQIGKERSLMSTLAMRMCSRSCKFNLLCSGGGLPLSPFFHLDNYIQPVSYLMYRLSPPPSAKKM